MTEQTALPPPLLDGRQTWSRRLARHALPTILFVATLAIAAIAIHHEMQNISLQDIAARLADLPAHAILASLAFTALSYVTLVGYDASAFRYLRIRTPMWRLVIGSFCGYAVANTAGFALLTGATARYRIHASGGLSFMDAGRIALFAAFAFMAGVTLIGAVGLLLAPNAVTGLIGLPEIGVQVIALVMLLAIGSLLVVSAWGGTLRFGRFAFKPPSFRLAVVQLALSVLEILASGASLYMLLPPDSGIGFAEFLPVYCAALAAGILSHVPGGVGVFDAVILAAFSWRSPPGAIIAALLLYRLVYYLVPFALSIVVLAFAEVSRHSARAARQYVDIAEALAPWVGVVISCIATGLLLLSGATSGFRIGPAALGENTTPGGVATAASFLSSIAASALMIMMPGLFARRNAAFWLTITLMVFASGLALLKGFAIVEAAIYFGLALLLVPFREAFRRSTAFVDQPLTWNWMLVFGVFLLTTGYVTYFAFDDPNLRPQADTGYTLWRRILGVDDGNLGEPRWLIAVSVLLLFLAIAWLAFGRPTRANPAPPSAEELELARRIVARQENPEAHIAVLDERTLFFSQNDTAFVAFSEYGGSWIALGDPVGPGPEAREMIWKFLAFSTRAGKRAIFYLASEEMLTTYADAGFELQKIADEAKVDLVTYGVQNRSALKAKLRLADRMRLEYRLYGPGEATAIMPQLAEVSQQWLDLRNLADSGFFVGRFDPAWIARSYVAVAFKDGTLSGFATILATDQKVEAQLDLLRHVPRAPTAVPAYLVYKTLHAFRDKGYYTFNLGIGPTQESESEQATPRMRRIGTLARKHGEAFYRTRGLRSFKEDFGPTWTSRYLAYSERVEPIAALDDVAAIISGQGKARLRAREEAGVPPLTAAG